MNTDVFAGFGLAIDVIVLANGALVNLTKFHFKCNSDSLDRLGSVILFGALLEQSFI